MYDFDDYDDDYNDDSLFRSPYSRKDYDLPTCRDCEETCCWTETENGWELYDIGTDEPHICNEETRHALIADEFEEVE